MLLKTERKKSDEKDYFAFYGAYYGAVAGGIAGDRIGMIFNIVKIRAVIKGLAKVHKKKEEAPAAPAAPAPKPDDVVLLEEIRDLLKNHK